MAEISSCSARIALSIEPLRTGSGQQYFFKLFLKPKDRSGSFVPVRFANISKETLGRGYLPEEDYAIVERLRPFCSSHLGDGVPITAGISGAFIDGLVSVGQIFFQSEFDKPLRRGGIRRGTPQWQLLDDGVQIPSITLSPEASDILPTEQLRYLDRVRNEIGGISTSVAGQLVARWMRIPVLGRSQALSPEHEALLTRHKFPLPKRLNEPAPVITARPAPQVDEISIDIGEQGDQGPFRVRVTGWVGGKAINILPSLIEYFGRMDGEAIDRALELPVQEIQGSNGESLLVLTRFITPLIPLIREGSEVDLDDSGDASCDPSSILSLVTREEIVGVTMALSPAAREIRSWMTKDIVLPEQFVGRLRDYQVTGVQWLQLLSRINAGGILADDMGLGKTIQVLAHLAIEKASGRLGGPSVLVCPKSLLPNWQAEIRRFIPHFTVTVIQERGNRLQISDASKYDLILTSYSRVSRDIDLLSSQEFVYAILDESQYIKNRESAVSQDVCRIKATQRICLTGTPIENNLGDLWAQFRFLSPSLFGSYERFERRYRRPIEVGDSRAAATDLKARITPLILRRTKDGVARDLPALSEIERLVEMTEYQRTQYLSVARGALEEFRNRVRGEGISSARFFILRVLLRLRQICCDPRLCVEGVPPAESAKLQVLMELLQSLGRENRRALVFSQFTSMLDLIEEELRSTGISYLRLDGSTQDREFPVRTFQEGATPVFLISLRAGGTGLNLTAADTVIHYDPWWNPAVGEQATARAHRIGQSHPVFAYHLVAANTIEERVRSLQQRKREIAASVVTSGGMGNVSMTDSDIEFLLSNP